MAMRIVAALAVAASFLAVLLLAFGTPKSAAGWVLLFFIGSAGWLLLERLGERLLGSRVFSRLNSITRVLIAVPLMIVFVLFGIAGVALLRHVIVSV